MIWLGFSLRLAWLAAGTTLESVFNRYNHDSAAPLLVAAPFAVIVFCAVAGGLGALGVFVIIRILRR